MLPTFDCVLIQPDGHLLLMIARTPLAYLLTIVAAEYILGQIARGIYLFQVYQPHGAHRLLPKVFVTIKSRQERFFMPVDNWCVLPRRTEARVRDLICKPWSGDWVFMPRVQLSWDSRVRLHVLGSETPGNLIDLPLIINAWLQTLQYCTAFYTR